MSDDSEQGSANAQHHRLMIQLLGFPLPTGPCSKCGHDHKKDARFSTSKRGLFCMVGTKHVRQPDGSWDGCGGEIPAEQPGQG